MYLKICNNTYYTISMYSQNKIITMNQYVQSLTKTMKNDFNVEYLLLLNAKLSLATIKCYEQTIVEINNCCHCGHCLIIMMMN